MPMTMNVCSTVPSALARHIRLKTASFPSRAQHGLLYAVYKQRKQHARHHGHERIDKERRKKGGSRQVADQAVHAEDKPCVIPACHPSTSVAIITGMWSVVAVKKGMVIRPSGVLASTRVTATIIAVPVSQAGESVHFFAFGVFMFSFLRSGSLRIPDKVFAARGPRSSKTALHGLPCAQRQPESGSLYQILPDLASSRRMFRLFCLQDALVFSHGSARMLHTFFKWGLTSSPKSAKMTDKFIFLV